MVKAVVADIVGELVDEALESASDELLDGFRGEDERTLVARDGQDQHAPADTARGREQRRLGPPRCRAPDQVREGWLEDARKRLPSAPVTSTTRRGRGEPPDAAEDAARELVHGRILTLAPASRGLTSAGTDGETE